jgi:hypothetical protein
MLASPLDMNTIIHNKLKKKIILNEVESFLLDALMSSPLSMHPQQLLNTSGRDNDMLLSGQCVPMYAEFKAFNIRKFLNKLTNLSLSVSVPT